MRMIRRLAIASVLAASAMAIQGEVLWTTSVPVGPPGHTVEVASQPLVTKDLLVVNAIYKNKGKPAYSVTCATVVHGPKRGFMRCPPMEEVNSTSPDSFKYAPILSQLPDPEYGNIIYTYSGSTTVPSGSIVPPVQSDVNIGNSQYKSTIVSWFYEEGNNYPSNNFILVPSQQIVSFASVNASNTVVFRSLFQDKGPKTTLVLQLAPPAEASIIATTPAADVYDLNLWTDGSARVRAYEEKVYHVLQGTLNGKSEAAFFQQDPKNNLKMTNQASIATQCGMTPARTFVQWDIIEYDFFRPASIPLNAFIFWGKDKHGQAVVCRISHNSFTKKWAVTLPNLASITSISGGSGYIVVSGPGHKAGTSIIDVIDKVGGAVFTKTRKSKDDGSAPVVYQQALFYGSSGSLIGVDIANGKEFFYKPFSCDLKPIITQERLYCVSGSTLVALSVQTEKSLWAVHNVTAAFPPTLDPRLPGTGVVVVRTDGTISVIGDLLIRPSTAAPPSPPEKKSHAAGIALGIIMSLLVVGGVTAGAIYYFKRVRPQSRNALPEDEIGSGQTSSAPTPKSGLYGAVNE